MVDAKLQAEKLEDFTKRGGNPIDWWESMEFTDTEKEDVVNEWFLLKGGRR